MRATPVAAAVLASAAALACAVHPVPERARPDASRHATRNQPLFSDDFRGDLRHWVVEQQPGGTVTAGGGRLRITDHGGCTVWWRQRLAAPVIIRYEAVVTAGGRVSDLNAFWMATDPMRPGDLFAPGHGRDGRFGSYDSLRTYYVGIGGNGNTTTRFRRYAGDGTRPLLPEHDLRDTRFLLEGGRPYRIALIACGAHVQVIRDGVALFDFVDPEPLRTGWFGLRTVDSRIEIRDFTISTARCD